MGYIMYQAQVHVQFAYAFTPNRWDVKQFFAKHHTYDFKIKFKL